MNGPLKEEYWKAACKEVKTLQSMGAWEVVDRGDGMNVIQSIWTFKLKHFPDSLIKKFKARFCARGNHQLEGIDFFETYAPVVQWTLVQMMLTLEILMNLESKQGDVTAAFLNTELELEGKICVEIPLAFRQTGEGPLPQENTVWFASKSLHVLEVFNKCYEGMWDGSVRI